MENKGKTTPNQPPIPRPVGFLYLYFPFVSSWLQVNYATTEGSPERSRRKQTQFSQHQNHHNLFYPKDLRQYSPSPPSKKQTQTNPIPPHRESIENRVSSIKYPALFMQNKPNSPKAKTNATSYATRIYHNIPLHPTPKNKAKTNPIYRGAAYGEAGSWRNTRYAIRNSQYAIRNTQYAIRDTRYAIRDTKSIPCPLPPNPVQSRP